MNLYLSLPPVFHIFYVILIFQSHLCFIRTTVKLMSADTISEQYSELFLTSFLSLSPLPFGPILLQALCSQIPPEHIYSYLTCIRASYFHHRVPTPSTIPLRVAKAGRNHLNEEITPSSPPG